MEILSYTSDLVAQYGNEMVVSIRTPNLFPIAQEVTRQRFIAAGKPEMFKETTVQGAILLERAVRLFGPLHGFYHTRESSGQHHDRRLLG